VISSGQNQVRVKGEGRVKAPDVYTCVCFISIKSYQQIKAGRVYTK